MAGTTTRSSALAVLVLAVGISAMGKSVEAAPDLALTNVVGPPAHLPFPGTGITYALTVANNGTETATGVVLRETVPIDMMYSGSPVLGWSCSGLAAGSTCTKALGSLAPGGVATATFGIWVVASATATVVTNTASVSDDGANGADPTPADNVATATYRLPRADLQITLSDGRTTFVDGASLTFTIQVTNAGPDVAIGAQVGFSPDIEGYQITSWTCTAARAHCANSQGSGNVYEIVDLPVGATITYVTRGTIHSKWDTVFQAGVQPSLADFDPDLGNNTATDRDTWVNRGVGDLNGDGRPDLVWRDGTTGTLSAWFMNGTNRVGGSALTPARVTDRNWRIEAIGDVDGDGWPDLIWRHQAEGWLYVWYMYGVAQTGGAYLTPSRVTDVNWKIEGLADFNGDGHPDLLWRHQTEGWLYLWYMDGSLQTAGSYLSPNRVNDTNWEIEAVGDFHGHDGKPDLIWRHKTEGWLYAWFMDGVTLTGGAYLTPNRVPDVNWRIEAVGDFDADGRPDLVWRNQSTGSLSVWYLRDLVRTSGASLGTGAPTNWEVVGPR